MMKTMARATTLAALFCVGMTGWAHASNPGQCPGEKWCSDGFYADASGSWGAVSLGPAEFTDIWWFPALPKGTYIANAVAVVAGNRQGIHYVDCLFKIGGQIAGTMARGTGENTLSSTAFVTLPLTIGFTIDQPQDLSVGCRADEEGAFFSQPSSITAIRLDTLEVKPGPVPKP